MSDTTLRHGDPVKIDYTPGADVAEGEVVLLGNLTGLTTGIAERPIANAELGSLAVGGGVYECINLDDASDFAKVYWDDTNKKVTTTSTNMAPFGFIVGRGGGGANSVCDVLHHPHIEPT